MPARKKLRLGFVGGCLAHQPGIPYARLFHRVLSRRMEDRFGIRIEAVVCDRHQDEPGERLRALVQEGPLDAVLLHRSTNTFFTKTAMVFVTPDGDYARYVLHPMLSWIRSRSWLQCERDRFRECVTLWKRRIPAGSDEPPTACEMAQQDLESLVRNDEARRFRLKALPWIAADYCGLVEWAIQDERRIVAEVHAVARQAEVPLFVLGPGFKLGYRWVNRFSRRLDSALDQAVASMDAAAYLSLLTGGPADRAEPRIRIDHYRDHSHYNAAGHALVADLLEPLLTAVVAPSPAASVPPSTQ